MSDIAADAPFTPAMPKRLEAWLPNWTIFFGGPKDVLHRWPKSAFEDLYSFGPFFGIRTHIVCEPESIRHVLLDNAANYRRPGLIVRMLAGFMGESLFTAEGESWREQRRVMAPVFTPAAINGFLPIFADAARRTADGWSTAGGRIDVSVESTRATLEVITEALFSKEGPTYDEMAEHMSAALASAGALSIPGFLGVPWLDPSPTARRGRKAVAFIKARFTAFIEQRQGQADPPQDFITRLLKAFTEKHGPKEAAQLTFDNAVTFFGAGHETTASGLTWALYLLSEHPEIQEKARAEAIAALGSGEPLDAVLARLPYLRQIWEETLRLYPPAARVDREAIADDVICDGVRIKKGDWIMMPTWVVQRHRKLWRDPDRFDPEHFSAEGKAGMDRFQYLPFGAGPRICIGMAFSNAEALLILAEWLSRYRFLPEPGFEVMPASSVTIRPRDGMPLRIEAV